MYQLPPNANDYPNRAPQGVELTSLRTKLSQRQKVIDQIAQNANAATATYESLKTRYEEQIQVLEKIESELRVAKGLMDSLTELAASPDPDMQQLQALLQPIRRYPDDHLRLMFEVYVGESREPFNDAITLSHVCQRWRDVAISTPRLWKCVDFNGEARKDVLKSKAEAFVARVKRVPAEITISIDVAYQSVSDATNSVKKIPFGIIYAAPVISSLKLSIRHETEDPSHIFDAIHPFPRGDVKTLLIYLRSYEPVPFRQSPFVSKFSGVRIFTLYGCSIELPVAPAFILVLSNIVELRLEAVTCLDTIQLLRPMRNNLQKLKVQECNLGSSLEPFAERCTMIKLCRITVDCEGFPWNQIQCPRLIHLGVPDVTRGLKGEHFWQFCSNTESITSADINLDGGDLEQFTRLARSAPHLRTLYIKFPTDNDIASVLVRHDRLDRPPFPDLLRLIFNRVEGKLKADTLDSLFQRRCIPRDHPESMLDPRIANSLEKFELTTTLDGGAADWKCSRYLASQPPSNPNLNRNRAPQGAELASLRTTALHMQSVIDNNTQAATVALERYEEIKLRYDAQVLILEEIASELHAAKFSADVLQKHTSSLEAELQELQGLLHPIRRCPDDVLRLIFEAYVANHTEFMGEGFASAVCLSHVCRRWRIMTLSMPNIWTHAQFKAYLPADKARSKAEAFIARVKTLPTIIRMNIYDEGMNLDSPRELVATIPFTRIYKVPTLSRLVLSIDGDHEEILDAMSVFPNNEIDSLYVEILDRPPTPLDFGSFLSKFKPFRKLELDCVEIGSLISNTTSQSLSKLEEIDFTSVGNIPIMDLLAASPQLRTLSLRQCDVRSDMETGIDQCTSPNLSVLSIDCLVFPWSKIRCPSLVELDSSFSPSIPDPDSFWEFILECPILTKVSCHDPDYEQVALLARSAPKLKNLHLVCNDDAEVVSVITEWQEFQLPSPPFPELQQLIIRSNSEHPEAATLEALIRSRCLLTGHPESWMDDGVTCALTLLEIHLRFETDALKYGAYLANYVAPSQPNSLLYQFVGDSGGEEDS